MTDRPRYAAKAEDALRVLKSEVEKSRGLRRDALRQAFDCVSARLSEAVAREAVLWGECKRLRSSFNLDDIELSDAARELLEKVRFWDRIKDKVLCLRLEKACQDERDSLQRENAALKGDIEVEREGAGYLRTKLTWATKERQAMEKREARCLHDCVHHEGCVLLVGGERRAETEAAE